MLQNSREPPKQLTLTAKSGIYMVENLFFFFSREYFWTSLDFQLHHPFPSVLLCRAIWGAQMSEKAPYGFIECV